MSIQNHFPCGGGTGCVTVTITGTNVSNITVTMTCGDIVRYAISDASGIARIRFSSAGVYTFSASPDIYGLPTTIFVVKGGQYAVHAFADADDWQYWVTAGELDPNDYAALSTVIASEDAMQALANSSAAVNYVIASTEVIMPAVVASTSAMTQIGLSSYAMNACIASAAWRTAICASSAAIAGLDASSPIDIPAMTSFTAPSGEATASSQYNNASYNSWHMFDKVANSSGWVSSGTVGLPEWSQYGFDQELAPDGVWVYKMTLRRGPEGDATSLITILASNDGVNFDVVVPQTTYSKGTVTITPAANRRYRYFRMQVNAYNGTEYYGGRIVQIHAWNVYGK